MATQTMTQAPAKPLWQVDPMHAHLEFAVRHLMIHTVRGRFTEVKGTVRLDPAHPTGAEVDVTIAAASVHSDVEQRDQHLRSADFLDVEKYPTITYKSQRVEQVGDDELTLVGDLTIHGVTKEVVLTVAPGGYIKDPWGGERMAYGAKGKLNRKDFGLVWNVMLEAGGGVVGDEVRLTLEVELIKQAG